MAASLCYEAPVVDGGFTGGVLKGSPVIAGFEQWCSVFRVCPDVELDRYPFARPLSRELEDDKVGLVKVVIALQASLATALQRLPDLQGVVTSVVLAEAAVLIYRLRLRASIVADMSDMLEAGDVQVFAKVIDSAICDIERDSGWANKELWPVGAFLSLTHVMADRFAYDAQEFASLRADAVRKAKIAATRADVSPAALVLELGSSTAALVSVIEMTSAVVVGKGVDNLASLVKTSDTCKRKPVIPVEFYDFVLRKGVDFADSDELGFADMVIGLPEAEGGVVEIGELIGMRACVKDADERFHFEQADLTVSYAWMYKMSVNLVASRVLMHRFGYCYLKVFPPDARLDAARRLRQQPCVRDVYQLLDTSGHRFWCETRAKVSGTIQVLHVATEGVVPLELWPSALMAGDGGKFVQFPINPVVGAARNSSILKKGGLGPPVPGLRRAASAVTTYYDPEVFEALGPTFGFGMSSSGDAAVVAKANFVDVGASSGLRVHTAHKRTTSASSFTEMRNILSPAADQATLRSLAQGFFEDLGVETSVKTRPSVDFASAMVIGTSTSEWAGRDDLRRDTQRMHDVEARMQSGAFLSKKYCKAVASRHSTGRSRPDVGPPRGRVLHVGDMYAPRVASNVLDWEVDSSLAVPGWTTYKFKFGAGEQTVTFVPPMAAARDVRMDWDGVDASLSFANDLRVPAEATVVWFSYAVTLTIIGTRSSVVRVSVPVRGMAEALGSDARRFTYFCDAVAVSDFDKVLSVDSAVRELTLKPRWRGAAGAARYYAKATYDSAAIPYKIRLLPREGGDLEAMIGSPDHRYAMVGFRSTVLGALSEVRVAGITFYPGKDGKIVVVTNQWGVGFHFKVAAMTTLKVSFVYITDPCAFEVNYMGVELETPTT